MVRHVRLGSSLLLALCAGGVGAQETQAAHPGQRLQVAGAPQHYRMDLDTRWIRPDPESPSQAGLAEGAAPCFANDVDVDPFLPGQGIADALLVGENEEVVDWGVKFCSQSGLVESIRIGYGSQAVFGEASLRLNVYAGTQGFGTLGTEVARIELDGLPASGPAAILVPFYMTIDLGSQAFLLPEGPIGWGYLNVDGLTAPLLVDVGPETSTQNYIDYYAPGPASRFPLTSTFTLGPGGISNDPFENSLYLVIVENPGTTAASVEPIGSASNSDVLSALAGPVLGAAWEPRVDLPGESAPVTTSVFLASAHGSGQRSALGELLVDPVAVFDVARGAGGVESFSIPADPALLGRPVYAQGVVSSPAGKHLTNALAGTIGF